METKHDCSQEQENFCSECVKKTREEHQSMTLALKEKDSRIASLESSVGAIGSNSLRRLGAKIRLEDYRQDSFGLDDEKKG